jgi:hypothetical protein
VIHTAIVSHHLIEFTRECLQGRRRVVVLPTHRRRARHARSRHRLRAAGGSRAPLRGFGGVGPEIVVALPRRQARWNLFPVKEVAHDAIGDRPVIAVHAVVVRAQRRVSREL